MYDIEEAERINKYLDNQEHNLMGQPIFRLVWAEDQREFREGTYNEFYKSILVRTVYGIKEVPKYPFFLGCWVLEQWFDPSLLQSKELKQHNGYEAIYCFRNKFTPLPLRLRVVELIMKAKKNYRKSSMLSKSILQQAIDDKEEQAFQRDMDEIDPRTPIEASLHLGDGISMHVTPSDGVREFNKMYSEEK